MKLSKLLFIFFLYSSSFLFGQTKENKNAISYQFLITDYNTIDTQYRKENPKRFFHPDDVNYALEIGYARYINSSVTVSAPLRFGTIDAYHLLIDSTDGNCIGTPCNKRYFRKELFGSIGLLAKYKFNNGYILKEDYFLQPYIQSGVHFNYMQNRAGNFDVQLPLTLGLQFRLNAHFSLQVQADYNFSFLAKKDNMIVGLGFVWLPKTRKNKLDLISPKAPDVDEN